MKNKITKIDIDHLTQDELIEQHVAKLKKIHFISFMHDNKKHYALISKVTKNNVTAITIDRKCVRISPLLCFIPDPNDEALLKELHFSFFNEALKEAQLNMQEE